jgi:hypothetical protein
MVGVNPELGSLDVLLNYYSTEKISVKTFPLVINPRCYLQIGVMRYVHPGNIII